MNNSMEDNIVDVIVYASVIKKVSGLRLWNMALQSTWYENMFFQSKNI